MFGTEVLVWSVKCAMDLAVWFSEEPPCNLSVDAVARHAVGHAKELICYGQTFVLSGIHLNYVI